MQYVVLSSRYCRNTWRSQNSLAKNYILDTNANQFILVDEAQTVTPLEGKTIITRVGHGTKIVFTGDPY